MRKLAWYIYQQRTSVISTIFNGQKLHFKNEEGVLYYITEGIKKLDKVVNQIDLPSNSVILDAGGNTGLFSLLLKTRFPDAEIYIIEPGEELIPIIEKNLEGQTKIKIIKKPYPQNQVRHYSISIPVLNKQTLYRKMQLVPSFLQVTS